MKVREHPRAMVETNVKRVGSGTTGSRTRGAIAAVKEIGQDKGIAVHVERPKVSGVLTTTVAQPSWTRVRIEADVGAARAGGNHDTSGTSDYQYIHVQQEI